MRSDWVIPVFFYFGMEGGYFFDNPISEAALEVIGSFKPGGSASCTWGETRSQKQEVMVMNKAR